MVDKPICCPPRSFFRKSVVPLAVFCMVAVFCSDAAYAQPPGLPGARLYWVYPSGGKLGTTVDVKIGGEDLDGASKLLFTDPGITATQQMAEPGLGQTGPQPVEGSFTVTIAPQVRPGFYEVRAIGKYGISNPRLFVVGTQNEIVETEPNNETEQAVEVTLGSIANGRSDSGTDLDFFKFKAQQGQRIVIESWAYRIDSRMDTTLTLYDASGRQLAHNRDASRRDALLDFTAPAEGEYFVELRDFVYEGGTEYYYRLSFNGGPHIDFIFPPVGVAGTQGQFTVYGRNLPGGQPAPNLTVGNKLLEMLNVSIPLPGDPTAPELLAGKLIEPDESGIDAISYQLESPQGISNPVLVGVTTVPLVIEQEPNDDPVKSPVLQVPCEYVGQFYPQRDRDWVSIQAKQGEEYWIELLSQRLGIPTDPVIVVQQVTKNEQGQEEMKDVQTSDDLPGTNNAAYNTTTDDPLVRFSVPADGLYRILVRDLYSGSRSDPRNVYRLRIHAGQPDFRLVAIPRFPPSNPDPNQNQPTVWSPLLRRGGTELIDIVVFHRDGFNGEIQVSAEGLPAGVTSSPITIGPDQKMGTLVLAAAEDAAEATGFVRIVGKAKIRDAEVSRVARTATMVWGGQANQRAPRSRMSGDLPIAVSSSETAPFSVAAGQNLVLEMCRAGKVQVPVTVNRRGEFKGNVALSAAGLPANVQPQNLNLDGNTGSGNFEINIQNNAPLGTYTFHLLGTSQVSYARNPEAAQAAAERKAAIDKLAVEASNAAKAAADAKAAAERIANEKMVAAQQAVEAQKAAEKAAADADAELKAAMAKAQEAQAALEKDPNNQGLIANKQQADKAVEDATNKAKATADAKTAAEKAAADAAAQAKTAADEKAAAEKAAAEADAKNKEVATFQQNFAKVAEDLANKAKPANVNYGTPSTTITLKITAAPITMTVAAPTAPLKQASKIEIPVTINRLYNFADPVPVRVKVPGGVGGLNIPEVTIPQGQNQATLVIDANQNATPGTHTLTIETVPRFNNQELTVSQQIPLTIEKVEPPK